MSLSATKLLLDRKATLKMGGEIHCILAEVFVSLSLKYCRSVVVHLPLSATDTAGNQGTACASKEGLRERS